MADFIAPSTQRVARKPHRCAGCFGPIPVGEVHEHQKAFWDGAWQENRFHAECWAALFQDGEDEFCPGELEWPVRIAASKGGGKPCE